ncbi:MAG: lipid-binding SYLF domain-containing protein [Nitrospinales bacterium]
MRYINLIFISVFLFTGQAQATGFEEKNLVNGSLAILQDFMTAEDAQIPSDLIKKAKAIIIFPAMYKGGFIFGARYGKGVVSVRSPKTDKWGPPAFIHTLGGSWGLQVGLEAVELVLLVMSQRGMEGILQGKFTLGGDIAVAAGPVGRYSEASMDILLKTGIFSYSRTRGIFAGVSIKGAALVVDEKANYRYYRKSYSTRDLLMTDKVKLVPQSAKRFMTGLDNLAFPEQLAQPAMPIN